MDLGMGHRGLFLHWKKSSTLRGRLASGPCARRPGWKAVCLAWVVITEFAIANLHDYGIEPPPRVSGSFNLAVTREHQERAR